MYEQFTKLPAYRLTTWAYDEPVKIKEGTTVFKMPGGSYFEPTQSRLVAIDSTKLEYLGEQTAPTHKLNR
jgi:hypothetical protein